MSKKKTVLISVLVSVGVIVVLATITVLLYVFRDSLGFTISFGDSSQNSSIISAGNVTSQKANTMSLPPAKVEKTPSKTNTTSVHIEASVPVSSEEVDNFDEEKCEWFQNLYDCAEEQYIAELDAKIHSYDAERSAWSDKEAEYATQELHEQKATSRYYAERGLLDSGAYKNAITNLNLKYSRLYNECRSNINYYSELISELRDEKKEPDPEQILAIIAINNNMSASEVLDYYEEYIE